MGQLKLSGFKYRNSPTTCAALNIPIRFNIPVKDAAYFNQRLADNLWAGLMTLSYKFIKIDFYNLGFRVLINLSSSDGSDIKLEAKVKSKLNFIFSDNAVICFYEILNFKKFYFILSGVITSGFWACHRLWALNECLASHIGVSARHRISSLGFDYLDAVSGGEGGFDG
jgi:hypothetical protein